MKHLPIPIMRPQGTGNNSDYTILLIYLLQMVLVMKKKQISKCQAKDHGVFFRQLSKRELMVNFLVMISANLLPGNVKANIIKKEKLFHQSHEYYMQFAIEEAKKIPKYPFGAVIVNRLTGEIISRGYNQSIDNPTLHGEIVAINNCAIHRSNNTWSEFDLYTTAEPCPMCQSAIEWAGIKNVFYGTSIPFLQNIGWKQINIRAQEVSDKTPFRNTEIIGGLLEEECNKLFQDA